MAIDAHTKLQQLGTVDEDLRSFAHAFHAALTAAQVCLLDAHMRTRPPHLRRDWARRYHNRDWAHPGHIRAGTGLTTSTSAPGLSSRPPHLRWDWAHPGHICAGTGLTPATSAPGLGSPRPHLQDTIRSELRAEVGAIAERLAAAEAELPEALHAAADTRALAVAVAALRAEQEEACAAVTQRVSESAAAFAEQVAVIRIHRGRLVFRIVRAVAPTVGW